LHEKFAGPLGFLQKNFQKSNNIRMNDSTAWNKNACLCNMGWCKDVLSLQKCCPWIEKTGHGWVRIPTNSNVRSDWSKAVGVNIPSTGRCYLARHHWTDKSFTKSIKKTLLVANTAPTVWFEPLQPVRASPTASSDINQNKENVPVKKKACVCQLDWCDEVARLHTDFSFLRLPTEAGIRSAYLDVLGLNESQKAAVENVKVPVVASYHWDPDAFSETQTRKRLSGSDNLPNRCKRQAMEDVTARKPRTVFSPTKSTLAALKNRRARLGEVPPSEETLYDALWDSLKVKDELIQSQQHSLLDKDKEIDQLKASVRQLEAMNDKLKNTRGRMDWSHLCTLKDQDVKQLTGFRNFAAMQATYNAFNADSAMELLRHQYIDENGRCKYAKLGGSRSMKLSSKNRFYLCFYILRTGATVSLAAFEFGIDKSTAGRYFKQMLAFLGTRIRKLNLRLSQDKNEELYPNKFLREYPGQYIRDIIDCLEIFVEPPTHLGRRWAFYSDYKDSTTVKFLISISPQGVINFVSLGFPGRISDPQIVERSGYLDILEPGDTVLADKGFKIFRALSARQCRLILPPFKYRGKDRTFEDFQEGEKTSNLRIHIERANKLIKDWRILQHTVPHHLIPFLSDILAICCYMVGQQVNLTGSDFYDES
jgi:hypothetical protein